jgi:hypothetical protein
MGVNIVALKSTRHSGESRNPARAIASLRLFCRRAARAHVSWFPDQRFAAVSLSGITFFFLLSAALPALAVSACYTPAELHAEHLLRLHSELMVITVTCHVGSQNEDLVSAYTGFTKNHISALHEAENTMSSYYSQHGGHGQDKLDKLRTKLGNEFGQKIADMSAQPFCDAYRDKVLAFYRASPADVQGEVQRMEASDTSYIEPCLPKTHIAKAAQ